MHGRIIFWGTGIIGTKAYRFASDFGFYPDAWCDNNSKVWGEKKEDIPILSPKEIDYEKDMFFLLGTASREIEEQVLNSGGKKERIVCVENGYLTELVYYLSDKIAECISPVLLHSTKAGKRGVLFDLGGGLVLGGVERWSLQSAEKLAERGICGGFLIPQEVSDTLENTTPYEIIRFRDILDCMSAILRSGYQCIICNFPFECMMAACIIKKYIHRKLKVIAVIHNDEEIYYKTYGIWQQSIDEYWVISEVIKNKIMEIVLSPDKITVIKWQVSFQNKILRKYGIGKRLRIGYAARLVLEQKRVDRLIELALKLKQKKVDYVLEIAGDGEAYEMLKESIRDNSLENQVVLLGRVPHEQIQEFWREKDIYVNCSDFEGHSISQVEAMACGVIPVATDTSGVRDDITDGYNGFVVPLGDIQGMADKIEYLYQNPGEMERYSKRAQETIRKANDSYEDPFLRIV